MTYKDLLKQHEDETHQKVTEDKILYFIWNAETIKQKMENKNVSPNDVVNIGYGAYVKKEYYDEVNAMFDRHAKEQTQYALNHTYEVIQHYCWDYELAISLTYTYDDVIYKFAGLTKDQALERKDEINRAIEDYKKEFERIN